MDPILKKLLIGSLYAFMGALGVYAIWIEPFLRSRGKKTASIFLTLIGYPGPIFDYLKGRKLAKRLGHVPWYFRAFEVLLACVVLGLFGSLAVFLLDYFGIRNSGDH